MTALGAMLDFANAAERVRLALPAKSMGYLPLFVAQPAVFIKDEKLGSTRR